MGLLAGSNVPSGNTGQLRNWPHAIIKEFMSKCKGCPNQSRGSIASGESVTYCIGSPDDEPKYGSEKVIDQDRIIKTGFEDHTIYRASDEDECHLWFSNRFNKE